MGEDVSTMTRVSVTVCMMASFISVVLINVTFAMQLITNNTNRYFNGILNGQAASMVSMATSSNPSSGPDIYKLLWNNYGQVVALKCDNPEVSWELENHTESDFYGEEDYVRILNMFLDGDAEMNADIQSNRYNITIYKDCVGYNADASCSGQARDYGSSSSYYIVINQVEESITE